MVKKITESQEKGNLLSLNIKGAQQAKICQESPDIYSSGALSNIENDKNPFFTKEAIEKKEKQLLN